MIKSIIIRFISLIYFFSIICLKLNGQETNFTGYWKLQKRESISGPEYANGVPLSLVVTQYKDSIFIKSISQTNDGIDTTTEKLSFSGGTFQFVTKANRRKIVSINWTSDLKGLLKQCKFISANPSADTEFQRIQKWSLTDSGNSLTILKTSQSLNGNDQLDYVMSGTYHRELSSASTNAEGVGDKEVRFGHLTSWDQALARAKSQGKFIFLDCFTTWCTPCKKMEAEVYTNPEVADYLNTNFISYKLQFDTTNKDVEEVKRLYSLARKLDGEFSISIYPTFLFFDSIGKIVHRDYGFQESFEFLETVKASLNPKKQFYVLMNKYEKGLLAPELYYDLALHLKKMDRLDQSQKMAKEYDSLYLKNADDSILNTKDNLLFYNSFPAFLRSNSNFFKLCYHNPEIVDKTLDFKGYAIFKVEYIVAKEEIYDKCLFNGNKVVVEPDWYLIEAKIKSKYPKIDASLLVRKSKPNFYRKAKSWTKYCGLIDEYMKNEPPRRDGHKFGELVSGMDDLFGINNVSSIVFNNSTDKTILERALVWINFAIEHGKGKDYFLYLLDTKANLLYKLRRIREAIAIEEQLVKEAPNGFTETLNKMKAGVKTWSN